MSNVAAIRKPSLSMIMELQEELKKLPQAEFPIAHYHAPGLYVRAILIREGYALTGAIHAKDHLAICAGDLSVMTEDGMQRFTGFHILPSKAGIKRAGLAHTDTFFATIHATDKTDLAEIEAECTLPDPVFAIEGDMP